MIEIYKLLTRKEDIDPEIFFKMTQVRGDPDLQHNLKIFLPFSRLDTKKFSFAHRGIIGWNDLNKKIVEVDKTSAFKGGYDELLADIYMWED